MNQENSWLGINRSSHRRCSVRKGVLRNFAKFTSKHLHQILFFNKVAGLRPAALLKKRPWHKCFHVNFAKFLKILFLKNGSERLLLNQRKLWKSKKKTLKNLQKLMKRTFWPCSCYTSPRYLLVIQVIFIINPKASNGNEKFTGKHLCWSISLIKR